MKTITYRQLQRLTVKELADKIPCLVLVDGQPLFQVLAIDSQGKQVDSQGYVDDRSDVLQSANRFNQGIKTQGALPHE